MTQEQEEKWIRRIVWVKAAAFLLSCIVLFIAFRSAEAAEIGNTTGETPTHTSFSIRNDGSPNSLAGLMQTFELTATIRPASLKLWLTKTGTPADETLVQICAYPNESTLDPCSTGSVIQTWTIDNSTLPAHSATPPGATPITLTMDEDMILYPSVPYAIHVERTFGDASNFVRWAYSDGNYAGGYMKKNIYGSCGDGWLWPNATSPSDCSSTGGGTFDLMFALVTSDDATLTISAATVGGSVYVSGICVEPDDLPLGWTLDANTVAVRFQDTASNGTWVLNEPDCTGGYTTSRALWNGDFLVTATQSGSPTTFTASATFTIDVEDNPIVDPVSLAFFGCEDLGYEEESLQCRLFNGFRPLLYLAPYSWLVDIKTTFDSTNPSSLSAVITVPAELGAGEERTFSLYSSAATNTGLVAELNALPEVGDRTLREWFEMALWLGIFGAYAALRIYSLTGGANGGDL